MGCRAGEGTEDATRSGELRGNRKGGVAEGGREARAQARDVEGTAIGVDGANEAKRGSSMLLGLVLLIVAAGACSVSRSMGSSPKAASFSSRPSNVHSLH